MKPNGLICGVMLMGILAMGASCALAKNHYNGTAPLPHWQTCTHVSDCTLAIGICESPLPINRRHWLDVKTWHDRVAPAVDCVAPAWPKTVCLTCEKSKCVVQGK